MVGFTPQGTSALETGSRPARSYAHRVARVPRRSPVPAKSALEPVRFRALVHEIANLLAAIRMSGHFLASNLPAAERAALARDIERLTCQSGALLGQLRPLLDETTDHRANVSAASLLAGLAAALEGAIAPERLRVAKGRTLPEVRVDADAIHQVLIALVTAATGDSAATAAVRVTARRDGGRVILSVIDEAKKLELAHESGSSLRGRELSFVLADAVLRTMGGRVKLGNRRRGNQIELWLPVARTSIAATSRPVKRRRAGRDAPRRP